MTAQEIIREAAAEYVLVLGESERADLIRRALAVKCRLHRCEAPVSA